MRSYPCNSPRAAARVVALTALADGHISPSELGALDRLEAAARLGLSSAEVQQVVQHLSEDLVATAYAQWGTACQIDPAVLQSLMAEVTDPALRVVTLELCAQVAQADFHVTDAEHGLVRTASRRWSLDDPLLQPPR